MRRAFSLFSCADTRFPPSPVESTDRSRRVAQRHHCSNTPPSFASSKWAIFLVRMGQTFGAKIHPGTGPAPANLLFSELRQCEVRRIPLLSTRMNSLLGGSLPTFPLHGVQDLLRLGQRLVELHRRSPEEDRHLLPLDIVLDDEAVLLALAHPEVAVGYEEQRDAGLGAVLQVLRPPVRRI